MTSCKRCGELLLIGPPGNPDARLLRRSDKPDGYCAECCLTVFLKTQTTIGEGVDAQGGPAVVFAMPHMREAVRSLCRAGQADLDPTRLDFDRITENWSLPVPKTKGGLYR
jgi:hypothetical protein